MFEALNTGFNFFIGLGAPAMMFIVITLLSLVFKVSFSKSIEGGLKMAIALTGMGAIISLLTGAFGPALNSFVESTGVSLSITDLGWAPLAVITWGSMYTLYFAFICIIMNLIMLFTSFTQTLNVDLFNIWNISIIGLIILEYSNNNIFITSIFVVFIYALMLINADVMKPTINELLDYEETNITTTAHPSLLVAPIVMIFNKLIDICIPFIDKYDFNAEILNKKIGFWGSKFAIGVYLGLFIGLLGQQSPQEVFTLAFTAGVALELFAYVGGWFGPAIEPLSDGVTTLMSKRLRGRKLFIAIDWPILASRAEVWAVANILAPILLIISMILPGNQVLPLGGILLTVLTPALLIVTKGKVIRMTIIGTIMIPLFLWAATLIGNFLTSASIAMNNFPAGLSEGQLFSSVDSDPLEKMLAVLLGKAVSTMDLTLILSSVAALAGYILMFIWYFKQMKKDNLKATELNKSSHIKNDVLKVSK
ncbi:PTS transporter subunit IIC [Enterococcus faecium]|uniref:PTS transporter subunit IIC n=1 Tax=Enterococcus TaxID=1350 RepID=UPI0001CEA55D|nr:MULTISPECIES: PTS transporter subunit IIC [Enterococcus]MDP8584279.1 PTS transporter subunit IIC [Listeria innocua]EFF19695.1 PTS system enzyme IIC component [Enterococcus faecium E1071]EFF28337.1 PTS system enzyme IIC component [Enterococcus faecium U0317]EGP5099021.1 PTS galactitol transporter subunit IIC [Enterococcus faecium]EGP5533390.1 PTS galactitol transporter subunit IIC [Enterococcus faecium]